MTDAEAHEGQGRKAREDFLALPPETPQPTVQRHLARIHALCGLEEALDCLHRWELACGYITREHLEQVERREFPDAQTGVTFRLQVNFARTRYTEAQERQRSAAAGPGPCLLCRENIGRPGKERLRVYELDVAGRGFFLQLTPFPLYSHHFVPVLAEHVPQRLGDWTMRDMVDLLRQAPGYTVVSNSDVQWAGASILTHLHYQMLRAVRLPVMDAHPVPGLTRQGERVSVELLDYPMAALRLRAREGEALAEAAATLLARWQGWDPGRNTANLNLIREPGPPGELLATVLLRNPDYRTGEELRRFKTEGVGVVEASGEAILPEPRGPEAAALWREIREGGLPLVKRLIAENSPPRDLSLLADLAAAVR